MTPNFLKINRSEVEPLIEKELWDDPDPTVPDNHNVFIPKRSAEPAVKGYSWPCAISFFHFDMDEDGNWLQQAYHVFDPDPLCPGLLRPILPPRAEELARDLANNARLPVDKQNPQSINLPGALDTTWNRVSWVIFVIDQAAWRFIPSSATGKAAIVCRTGPGLTANHSFFDAATFTVEVTNRLGGRQTLPAFRMINHMKAEDGTELPATTERFKFSMFVEVPTIPTNPMVWDIDPGGQNVGPPQPPPAPA